MLGEQANGLIIDWQLYKDKAVGDAPLLNESLKRIYEMYGIKPKSVTTDRGFFSKKNQSTLEKEKIKDYICPKPVAELKKKTKSKKFMQHQARRAQTEARIAIVKNVFLGKLLRSKGFRNRNIDIGWAVQSHNLWVLARMAIAVKEACIQESA